jgi:uncharacterized protein DUF1329
MEKPGAAIALGIWLALGSGSPAGAEVKPGMMLDASTADDAKDLLPPEIYEHYKKGEYYNRVVEFPDSSCRWDDGFEEATRQNGERLVLSPKREPVDRDTGTRPDYITGLPFPDIDSNDPEAGYKVLWNLGYTYYTGGNNRIWTTLNWVSRKGVERSVAEDVNLLFYDGQPRHYSPATNPANLLYRFLAVSRIPADVNGTASLGYRFKDPGKRDASWVYVPALRRVRAVSPANRSDGYLGSDTSQDDGFFFEGKVEDFTWKVTGHRDGMRLVDPDSVAGKVRQRALPGGGWRTTFLNNSRSAGFQLPKGEWKGVAWAPVLAALAKRRFWIVEGIPQDKYYLYGKIELWIDDTTWQGAWNRKFSWQGELENVYQVMAGATQDFDAHERWFGSTAGYLTAENITGQRASILGIDGPGEDPPNDRRIPLDPTMFDAQSLERAGK